MTSTIPCVILLGGESKRFYPFNDIGKSNFPLLGKPFIVHLISRLKSAGMKTFYLVTNPRSDYSYLKSYFPDLSFTQITQEKPLGTADAVMTAEPYVKDDFVVIAGDTIFDSSIISELLIKSEEHRDTSIVVGKYYEKTSEYGLFSESSNIVRSVLEKPAEPTPGYVNTSIYFFRNDVFDRLRKLQASLRGEYELTDALHGCFLMKTDAFWHEIGYPWKLFEALEYLFTFQKHSVHGTVENSVIRGKVIIEPGAEVVSSYIEGPVYIGKNTSIGPHSYIRAHTSIEADCEIGDSTTVKNSIILQFTKAKHLTYIGDSVIGRDCNFGSSTQIANYRFDSGEICILSNESKKLSTNRHKLGAFIGSNVRTGVSTVIYPGRIIGRNSWIYPATVVDKNVPENSKVYTRFDTFIDQRDVSSQPQE